MSVQVDIRALVLGLSRARGVDDVAQAVASGLATDRSVVLARVWIADRGASELRLTGSAGTPSGGGSYRRLDGAFSRIPIGAGKVGALATTREPHIVCGVRGDEEWLANPAWSARQGVRAFLAYPLIAGDEVVGVLAVFDREPPSEAILADLAFLAEVAAARVASLRERDALATSVLLQPPPPALSAVEGSPSPGGTEVTGGDGGGAAVVTRADLRRIEKENIAAALARTGGKVFGVDGAAALLGMKPTTLASRIKALRIVRGAPARPPNRPIE